MGERGGGRRLVDRDVHRRDRRHARTVRFVRALTALAPAALLVLLALPFIRSTPRSGDGPAVVADGVAMVAGAKGERPRALLDVPSAPLARVALASYYRAVLGAGDRFAFRAEHERGSPRALVLARWAWLAMGVLLVGLVGSISRALVLTEGARPRRWVSSSLLALFAATLVAVSRVTVSGVLAVDAAVLTGVLVLGAACLASLGRGGSAPWPALGAGFVLGAAAGSHELGLLLLPVAALVAIDRPSAALHVATAFVAAGLGALVVDPTLVEAPGRIFERAGFAAGREAALEPGGTLVALVRGLSPIPLALALVGCVVCARGDGRRRLTLVALALPVVGLLLVPPTGGGVLLCVPLLAILASIGVAWIAERTRRGPAVALVVAVAAIVWPALTTARRSAVAEAGDTRSAAAAWLAANLADSARVVTDFYGPDLPPVAARFRLPFDASRPEIFGDAYDVAWYEGFDTFVLVGTQFDRYRRSPDRFEPQLRFLAALRATTREAARFEAGARAGPWIEIRRREGPGPKGEALVHRVRHAGAGPPVPEFHLALGSAYASMGETLVAKHLFVLAANLAPGDPRLAVNVANLYIQGGELARADSLLRVAVSANPTEPKLRYQLGLVRQSRGRFGEAIGEYKMAIRANPTYVEAHFNLAICYFEVGNLLGARNSFTKVRSLAAPGELRREAERMLDELTALETP